mmetsp:Transcript_23936/g.35793  ORF Transcript_23936/g.35793 Transcript_23936/m.35793 type:complete len:81 (+) Transcript_23936:308-550(+)
MCVFAYGTASYIAVPVQRTRRESTNARLPSRFPGVAHHVQEEAPVCMRAPELTIPLACCMTHTRTECAHVTAVGAQRAAC